MPDAAAGFHLVIRNHVAIELALDRIPDQGEVVQRQPEISFQRRSGIEPLGMNETFGRNDLDEAFDENRFVRVEIAHLSLG
ncbi:hypothetical protein [Bosea sp. ANAM02]|uniref:hypothetical protein n=1 Tax=Bosea sp. ANAM02 TaxID=2020412 RepID=UPI0015660EBB|nr:hypothetical protein [Bosea sp. ANAM02]